LFILKFHTTNYIDFEADSFNKNYPDEDNNFSIIDIDSDFDSKFLAFTDLVKYFDPIGIIGCFHKDLYVSHNSFH